MVDIGDQYVLLYRRKCMYIVARCETVGLATEGYEWKECVETVHLSLYTRQSDQNW